jgi:hypothetical protein
VPAVAEPLEGGDQHQVVADVQPVDLDDQEVQLGLIVLWASQPTITPIQAPVASTMKSLIRA